MAPQPETGKSGWLKLATACYYCLASMTVQYMNKVGFLLQKTAFKGVCFPLRFMRLHHDFLNSALPNQSRHMSQVSLFGPCQRSSHSYT